MVIRLTNHSVKDWGKSHKSWVVLFSVLFFVVCFFFNTKCDVKSQAQCIKTSLKYVCWFPECLVSAFSWDAFGGCGYGPAFPVTLVPQGSRERQPLQKSWSGLSTSVPELDTSVGAVSFIPLRHLTLASATVLDWLLYLTNFKKLPLMWRVQHRNHWSTVCDFSDNFNSICGIFRGFQLSLSPDIALSPLPSASWCEVTHLRETQQEGAAFPWAERSGAVLSWKLLLRGGSLAWGFLTLLDSGVHRTAAELLLVKLPCWSSEITARLGASLQFLQYSCACKERAHGEIQGE